MTVTAVTVYPVHAFAITFVTERHSPRIHRVESVVRTSKSTVRQHLHDDPSFPIDETLDEIVTVVSPIMWTPQMSGTHGTPISVWVEAEAGYRRTERTKIKSGESPFPPDWFIDGEWNPREVVPQ